MFWYSAGIGIAIPPNANHDLIQHIRLITLRSEAYPGIGLQNIIVGKIEFQETSKFQSGTSE